QQVNYNDSNSRDCHAWWRTTTQAHSTLTKTLDQPSMVCAGDFFLRRFFCDLFLPQAWNALTHFIELHEYCGVLFTQVSQAPSASPCLQRPATGLCITGIVNIPVSNDTGLGPSRDC